MIFWKIALINFITSLSLLNAFSILLNDDSLNMHHVFSQYAGCSETKTKGKDIYRFCAREDKEKKEMDFLIVFKKFNNNYLLKIHGDSKLTIISPYFKSNENEMWQQIMLHMDTQIKTFPTKNSSFRKLIQQSKGGRAFL